MSDLLRSEIIKLRTTRTFWGLTLGALGLIVLVTVLTLALSDQQPGDDVRNVLSNAGIVGLFGLILGALGMTGEYRHGSVTVTFLAAPRRSHVIAAKAIASLAAGAVLGLVACAIDFAIVLIWFQVAGDSLGVSAGDIILIGVGSVAYAALAAALGLGVGALLRNQVATIIVLLGLLFIFEPVLAGLVSGAAKWTLTGLGSALSGSVENSDTGKLFPPGVAGLVMLGYGIVFAALAAAMTARRDVL